MKQLKTKETISIISVTVLLSGLLTALLLSPSAAIAGTALDQPLFMRQNSQPQDTQDGDHEAMHAACLRGDWTAMEQEMDRVAPDWRSHHQSMGSGNGMQDAPSMDMMRGGMMSGGMMGVSR